MAAPLPGLVDLNTHGPWRAYIFQNVYTESDSSTIEGLKRREPAAMAKLYDRYGALVYSVIFRVVGNSGEAEEIVQDVFLRVWMRAHLIEDSCCTLRPWILTIARNRAIDHVRGARPGARYFEHTTYERFPAPVCFDPFISLSTEAARLREALALLSATQRTVIEYAYFEGLSQSQIAARMEKPLGTVKTWVRSAMGALRKSITVSGPQTSTSFVADQSSDQLLSKYPHRTRGEVDSPQCPPAHCPPSADTPRPSTPLSA